MKHSDSCRQIISENVWTLIGSPTSSYIPQSCLLPSKKLERPALSGFDPNHDEKERKTSDGVVPVPECSRLLTSEGGISTVHNIWLALSLENGE
jgi:hypothetical protein